MSRAELFELALRRSQSLDAIIEAALALVRARQQESGQAVVDAGDNEVDRDKALDRFRFWMRQEIEYEDLHEQSMFARQFLEKGSCVLFLDLVCEIRATIARRKMANEPLGVVIVIGPRHDPLLRDLQQIAEKSPAQQN